MTCNECVHWSNEQWREFEKKKSKGKKAPSQTGTSSLKNVSIARSTPNVVPNVPRIVEPTPELIVGGMTADDFWRAERLLRDGVLADVSAPVVPEVPIPATAPPPGEGVVWVRHVGDSRPDPPSGESSAVPPSGVIGDVAHPKEDPVVPPGSPTPIEVLADPVLPWKGRGRRNRSYSSSYASFSSDYDSDDEESRRSRRRGRRDRSRSRHS